MKRYFHILLIALTVLTACEFRFKDSENPFADNASIIRRYDRIESRYLATGDFSALQEMNTVYPQETRTLIEDVLDLGEVDEPYINSRFLNFFQDSTLQTLISDAEAEYADMDDINAELKNYFKNLQQLLPNIAVPEIYAQIGALNQSIVIGNGVIGISLDKYLGTDYHIYAKYYSAEQRKSMNRSDIAPDCISFYLLSLYPMKNFARSTQYQRDIHMASVMWVANKAMKNNHFRSPYIEKVDKYMRQHKNITPNDLLSATIKL